MQGGGDLLPTPVGDELGQRIGAFAGVGILQGGDGGQSPRRGPGQLPLPRADEVKSFQPGEVRRIGRGQDRHRPRRARREGQLGQHLGGLHSDAHRQRGSGRIERTFDYTRG